MVDVSEKADTKRTAVAEATVELGDDAYAALDGAAGGGARATSSASRGSRASWARRRRPS